MSNKSRSLKPLWLVLILLALIGGAAFAWQWRIASMPASSPSPALAPAANDTPAPAPSPASQNADSSKLIIGRADAPITIIEYGDFQCPICKNFFEKTEPQLRKDYIDTGKAKIEFRIETHIGSESVLAGEAAFCANDQSKFVELHDALYRKQNGYQNGQFSVANLKKIAGELKLDQTKFDTCMDTRQYKTAVEASNTEAHAKISGTPTFFIGQQKIVGAQPYSIFKTILDAQ
jgi:protein-disulfide isomerase